MDNTKIYIVGAGKNKRKLIKNLEYGIDIETVISNNLEKLEKIRVLL